MIAETENAHGKSKKPYVKGTQQAVQERIELVGEMLSRGENSKQIRLALSKPPHNLEFRQIAEYVTRAREWLLTRAAGITKLEALSEAINFYAQVIANKKHHIRDRLEARKRLDLIFGLEAPRKLAIREEQLPQTPADDAARALDSGMLAALELVYGKDARNTVVEIAAKQLPPPETGGKKTKLKLA